MQFLSTLICTYDPHSKYIGQYNPTLAKRHLILTNRIPTLTNVSQRY